MMALPARSPAKTQECHHIAKDPTDGIGKN
jgi:hypothetical protein